MEFPRILSLGLGLTLLAPAVSLASPKAAPCAVDPLTQKVLEAVVNHMELPLYSNQLFARPNEKVTKDGSDTHFPPGTTIDQLSDGQNNLVLFRAIQGPYRKKFNGPFTQLEKEASSYSLAPGMVTDWSPADLILVAVQNIEKDSLTVPQLDWNAPQANYKKFVPASGNLRLDSIPYYDEVKVPLNKEKVLMVIPQKTFREILGLMGTANYRASDLVEKILASPETRRPLCGRGEARPVSESAEAAVIKGRSRRKGKGVMPTNPVIIEDAPAAGTNAK